MLRAFEELPGSTFTAVGFWNSHRGSLSVVLDLNSLVDGSLQMHYRSFTEHSIGETTVRILVLSFRARRNSNIREAAFCCTQVISHFLLCVPSSTYKLCIS